MTFQRSTRAVLAVAVLGLAQFALAANARADKPRFGEFSAWSAPVNIGPTINTPYEESAPAVSPDGRSLYFNRNTNGADPDQPGKIDEDIFVSRRQNPNKPWGAPQLVEVLNTDTFNERNVALSRDGKLLFFSSDRDAAGDLDLYVSKRVNGHHFARTSGRRRPTSARSSTARPMTSAPATSRTSTGPTSSTSRATGSAAPDSSTSTRASGEPTGRTACPRSARPRWSQN